MKIRFGPAGVPLSAKTRSTLDGIKRCSELGLSAMEVEFVHGVKMESEIALQANKIAKELDIELSIHAPYYINLCSLDKKIVARSIYHIFSSMKIGHLLKAKPIVIHTGFYQNKPKEVCDKLVLENYADLIQKAKKENIEFLLGPELTGKPTAYGNLEEIVNLSLKLGIDNIIPVIDFAHYYARANPLKSEEDYKKVLDYCEKNLGEKFAKNLHIHFSGIEFTEKGERKHLPVKSNTPPFKPLLKVLKEGGYAGKIICESPLLEQDALILQKEFEKI